MKKGIVVAALLCAVIAGVKVGSANAGQSASTSATVNWPDYHTESWKPQKQRPLILTVDHPPKGNDIIVRMEYDVEVGVVPAYINEDPKSKKNTVIIELDILGNGPVFRQMSVFDSEGQKVAGRQIKIDGKWTSIPNGSLMSIEPTDGDSIILKNTLTGVTLTIMDEEGRQLMALKLENKNKKK